MHAASDNDLHKKRGNKCITARDIHAWQFFTFPIYKIAKERKLVTKINVTKCSSILISELWAPDNPVMKDDRI